MCACARHIFYTFLLITPECDTPRSRAAGCTLNEKSQILHFILLKLPAIWKSLIPLTISVKLMPVPISSDVYLNDEILSGPFRGRQARFEFGWGSLSIRPQSN